MARIVGGLLYAFLLVTGALAAALALGTAFVHWATGLRPLLDAGGWVMATYGLAALAACSIIDRDVAPYTIVLLAAAVLSGFIAGRHTCGPLILLTPVPDDEP